MNTRRRIKSKLPEICRTKRISRKSLSESTGIPYQTIIRYCAATRVPPVTDALLIADVLKLQVEELYEISEVKP